jgi:hypothetical protein
MERIRRTLAAPDQALGSSSIRSEIRKKEKMKVERIERATQKAEKKKQVK